MKEAIQLLGKVTGWGDMVRPIIGYNEVRAFTGPDETVGTGRFVFLCAVTICGGSDDRKVQGEGRTLGASMLDCAHKVVEHHKQLEEWHRARRERAQRAIEAEFSEQK